MGWFNKKNDFNERDEIGMPRLPDLPRANNLEPPRLSDLDEDYSEESIPQLPTLPSTSMGDRFSQDVIKDAVLAPQKLEDYSQKDTEDWESEEMLPPLPRITPRTIESNPKTFTPMTKPSIKKEPMFIRLDKFEESYHIIEKTKKEIQEVEEMLRDTKKIKDEEEKELAYWEETLQKIKNQIDDVDKNLFSKL